MKKILLFFSWLGKAALPVIAPISTKNKTKTVVNPARPSVLVKDQPRANADIHWKASMMVGVPGGTFYRNDQNLKL
jgi:hypothetical protein